MARILLLSGLACGIVLAQSSPQWKFEVASVKATAVSPNSRPSFPQFGPGGKFTAGIPVRFVIAAAWNVGFQSVRLTGGPDWISSRESSYDIEAKAPEAAFPPGLPANIRLQRERQMLQAFLEDRFHLKIRVESRELAVYAVAVAKGGPKMTRADIEEKDCPAITDATAACHAFQGGRGRGLHAKAATIADMLGFVENWTDRPLVDQTGLQGLFHVETRGWRDIQPAQEPAPGTKAEDGSDAADVPTLFEVFDRLGLKLQSQKAAVEVFVIDRIERPSVN